MDKKLENYSLDLFDDSEFDKTLQKIASNLSSEVQQEELPTINDRDRLEDDQFALTLITKAASKINKFPIQDRVNTAFSNEYFELNHSKLPLDAQKIAAVFIRKSCEQFDITPHQSVKTASANFDPRTNIYVESSQRQSNMEKSATTISSNYYALGTKYAMPDEEYVRKAEQYFDKYAAKLTPEDRHEFATNVSNRSAELGVKIASANISRYSGSNYNPDMEAHLRLRERLLDEASPYVPALRKLASYKGTTEPVVFAKVLHEIDKKAGLDKHYDRALIDPFASTFANEKVAGYAYSKDGIFIEADGIKKMASDKYEVLKNYFGHTLADGLKKEGFAAFEALPTDAKDIVARIASGEIQ